MVYHSFEGGADDGFVEVATKSFVCMIAEGDMQVEVGFIIHPGDVTDERGDFMVADEGL